MRYAYYPVSYGQIKAAAENTRSRSKDVGTVVDGLQQEHRGAVSAVEGTLVGGAQNAPQAAVTSGNDVVSLAEYSCGCLEKFGLAVQTYDRTSADPRSIEKLNQAWSDGVSSNFGVRGPYINAHMDEAERTAARTSHAENVKTARDNLGAELDGEFARLENNLDMEAKTVATMLKEGPTPKNVRTLWGDGVLPPYAPVLFPQANLDFADLPPSSQAELKKYLLANPDLLTDPPPWVTKAIDSLPVTDQEDLAVMERKQELYEKGLLDDVNKTNPWYDEWIRNTIENGVPLSTVEDIARRHGIRPDDFDVLGDIDPTVDGSGSAIQDNTGKWFFLLPTDISGDDAEKAVLMTYILNAGTGYRDGKDTDGSGDYEAEDYDADEIQRIIDRQNANEWFSYNMDVGFVHANGGRLVTTPNGMMMGAGGNWLMDQYSLMGGTTWGDIFMMNMDDSTDPEADLRALVQSGDNPNWDDSDKDLDRLLHHEERHSQQWAEEGYHVYGPSYLAEAAISQDWVIKDNPGPTWLTGSRLWLEYDGTENDYEQDAGLTDGGYKAD